ncbi:MAG: SAM-dependent methyltransferase [Gammaproteobacteria bacterium]|nr:MAG: SAM-dependent methyltransferase [Gammaproteobacteria bacterium]
MAFDQSTRNRLQKFVNDARNLLTEEFTRQLQATYGLDPKAGSVAAVDSLTQLDNRQRQVAHLLREIVNHYVANSTGKNEKEKSRQALDRLVREQGFTILNRIAALRMAEARGLLIESVAKGYNSKGFQLYKMVAGTSHGETGDAYRNYLFSLFDEFSVDLELLFSRHSAQGQLFPREAVLLELLEQVNHYEIEHLWAEDETIGWIYQYYNSQEERKKMRKESQAPRTSRELAVRNQFFTPRYVVEFLVDNTLGRLWLEATAGNTNLYECCQYLLVKPEELKEKRSSTPPITLRDPRTIKLLDPACGSMHFGLYAFDLFLEIYREAWTWEQEHGPGSLDLSFQSEATRSENVLQPLGQTYASESDYLRDLPRLIIEHNIYGVDIDPRAAQIATLALWLRAQRAWHEAGLKAQDRPTIARGHVLAAVAPPAEQDLRERFAAQLDTLDAELFTDTLQLLKGVPEQGVLLQIEKELPRLVRQVFGEHGSLFKEADEQAWQKAEERLRSALTDFAEAGQGSFQNRLYAQDALQGLRLIDLCREVFDVVVMNPPFGALAANTKAQLSKSYPRSKNDLLAIMVERGLELLRAGGRIGAITSRTCFFLSSFQKWREQVVLGIAQPEVMADLGHGVMDDAMVEAAAYVLEKKG